MQSQKSDEADGALDAALDGRQPCDRCGELDFLSGFGVYALGRSHPTVSLSLDTSAFDAAINRARAAINSLGALIPGTGMGPSLGGQMRGNFSSSGIHGE